MLTFPNSSLKSRTVRRISSKLQLWFFGLVPLDTCYQFNFLGMNRLGYKVQKMFPVETGRYI